MGYIGKLLVKLGLDSKEFDNGINSAQKKSTDFSGAITKMGTAIIAAFSVDAVINFGKAAVNAYNESALAAAKLNAVLKSTGRSGAECWRNSSTCCQLTKDYNI